MENNFILISVLKCSGFFLSLCDTYTCLIFSCIYIYITFIQTCFGQSLIIDTCLTNSQNSQWKNLYELNWLIFKIFKKKNPNNIELALDLSPYSPVIMSTFIQNLVLQSQKRFLTPVGQPLKETHRGTGAWNSSLGQELINYELNDFGLLSFND